MGKPKFTGDYEVVLSVPMFEEAEPEKALGRILNRLQVIYGKNIKMRHTRLDNGVHEEIKPHTDRDVK